MEIKRYSIVRKPDVAEGGIGLPNLDDIVKDYTTASIAEAICEWLINIGDNGQVKEMVGEILKTLAAR